MKLEYLSKVLDELKADERSLILQKYQDNISISELAHFYGISESAVKMKLKRTRDKMRAKYAQMNFN